MGHVLGQERSSTHQPKVGGVKEKMPLSYSEETLQFQNRYKSGHLFEFGQTASPGQTGLPKSSEDVRKPWLGSKSCNGDYDELVKHMSNLPGFLQQVETENSIQDKALNFGVLEWKRLEKWKYTERMPRKSPKKTSSTGNSISRNGPPKMSPILRNQSISHGRNATTSDSGKQPLPRRSLFSSPPRQAASHDYSFLNPAQEKRDSSYHNEEKFGRPVQPKGKETCDQEVRASTIGRQQVHRDQRLQSKMNGEKSKKNNLKKDVMLRNEVSSSEPGKHKFPANKINSQGKKSEMQPDNELKLTTECFCAETQVPDPFRDNSCSESVQFMASRTSVDGQFLEGSGNWLYDFCATQDFDSGELSCDTSHSCPLPSVTTVPTQCATELHYVVNSSQTIGLDTRTKGEDSIMQKETSMLSSSIEASKNAPACIGEKPVVKGRASSPHRFSFDLGKVGRSFSFKDNSGLPQPNSTDISGKSGSVRTGVRSSMDNTARDKENAGGRGRSSPLRRLLDPILKHKGTESTDALRPMRKSLYSMTARTANTKGQSQDRKPEASVLQALLQLTLKNGRPCFKLVVDNSEDMLAAAVKSLPTSGKNDPCMRYTFYSVHEVRKKGMNWITHGSKSKNCSLGYDIIGQMKISNFCQLNENSSFSSDVKECVLYGINPGQVDKQALELVPSREIAAVIVKNGELRQPYGESEPERGTAETSSTTVILPGGVHGIPVKGAPSSLISRWKSGGLCDCGGWDIGCKLRILAEQNKSNNRHASTCGFNVHRLNLVLQSGEQKNKHVFSLEALSSGLYSIEFDASISLVEAFAICVAYVTCRKFPETVDMRGESDAENVNIATTEDHERKTPTKLQAQLPAQNISHPCPPLSPAGRI